MPVGQLEAARTLGFSEFQTLRLIRGPQAFRLALAPMTNDFVALLKDSSLVSVLTVVELTKQTQIFATNLGSWVIPGAICAALYLAMSLPLAALARVLERRWQMDGIDTGRSAWNRCSPLRDVDADARRTRACRPASILMRAPGDLIALRGPSGSRQDDDPARHRRARSVRRAARSKWATRGWKGAAARSRDAAPAAAQRRARLPVSLPLRAHVGAAERLPGTGPRVSAVAPRRQRSGAARELLKQLGVESRADAWPRELSGGEAQRVAIARALAVNPPVLLMDEPMASLDPSRRAELGALLQRLTAVWTDAARHHPRRSVREAVRHARPDDRWRTSVSAVKPGGSEMQSTVCYQHSIFAHSVPIRLASMPSSSSGRSRPSSSCRCRRRCRVYFISPIIVIGVGCVQVIL